MASIDTNPQYVIIGAGPAGLQLAYHLKKAGRDYVVLEGKSKAGAFFEMYPRHRKLISINKVYCGYTDPELNLRWDWNSLLEDEDEQNPLLFKQFSRKYFPDADDMLNYLAAFAQKHDLNIRYDSPVNVISKVDGLYRIQGDGFELKCEVLVMATGVSREHIPDIPGIEVSESYTDISVDPEDFANQRVLIIGKGNSAFETADNLVGTASMIHISSPNPLKMAWTTHYVGHLRAVNNNFLDTYQLKSQNAVIDAQIVDMKRVGASIEVTFAYAHANGEVESIKYDRVIRCTGFGFNSKIFAPDCTPTVCINGRFPEQTTDWESTNCKNMFFVGTISQMRDFKKQMSGFVHGFRYNVRTLSRMLEQRFHGVQYPERAVNLSPNVISEQILARINRSSGLWQQPGFLCDTIVVDRQRGTARYVEELSLDSVKIAFQDAEYFTSTLEFGTTKFDNPFAVTRIARDSITQADNSNFIHPVVRHFKDGQLVSEHHVIEDLAAEWVEPEHIQPLQAYLTKALSSGQSQTMDTSEQATVAA